LVHPQSLVHIIPSIHSSVDFIILRSVTPIHAGTGKAGGIVDLPIQRDEYGYPCLYSSSIKGALKTALLYAFTRMFNGNYENARRAVQALLGPEPEEEESFESSIAILDAYLLAIPIRSLRGVYAYVTTPVLLRKFYDRLELFINYLEGKQNEDKKGMTKNDYEKDKPILELERLKHMIEEIERELMDKTDMAICISGEYKTLQVNELEGKVVLVEEVFLDIKPLNDELKVNKDDIKLISELASKLKLEKPLLVISDDIAREIIERGLIRLTRVRLSRETKTVDTGPWTEEYLPPKTVLHSLVLYKKPPLSRGFINKVLEEQKENIAEEDYIEALKRLDLLDSYKAEKVKESNSLVEKFNLLAEANREFFRKVINEQLRGYIILGGHETIGKGIMKVEFLDLGDSL